MTDTEIVDVQITREQVAKLRYAPQLGRLAVWLDAHGLDSKTIGQDPGVMVKPTGKVRLDLIRLVPLLNGHKTEKFSAYIGRQEFLDIVEGD